jgi:hypothetical protein
MMVVGDENQELKNKLANIENHIQQQRAEAQRQEGWRTYNNNLDKAIKSTLAGRELDPEAEEVIRKAVTALATVNNSADPIEEVRTVLRPYMKVLSPAPKQAKPNAAPVQNMAAHKAVSMKGSAGNRQAGEKVGSAMPGKMSLNEARKMLFGSAKTEWDR